MSSGTSRHVFVQAFRPPFPDPRRWNDISYWQQYYYLKCEWMVPKVNYSGTGDYSSSFPSSESSESLPQETKSEAELDQQPTEEDSNDLQYELSEEWASRFAKTLENMKKRRRQQRREDDEDQDAIPKRKRRPKKQNQN